MCSFTRSIGQLDYKEDTNSMTNFPQNQEKPIKECSQLLKNNEETKKLKTKKKKKGKNDVYAFFHFLKNLKKFLRTQRLLQFQDQKQA